MLRYLVLAALSLLLSVAGYFFFAIVVAIYAGLWVHDEKMYYAQAPWCHLFGAIGVLIGILLAWVVWRLGVAALGRPGSPSTA
jgi:hypothetical protein